MVKHRLRRKQWGSVVQWIVLSKEFIFKRMNGCQTLEDGLKDVLKEFNESDKYTALTVANDFLSKLELSDEIGDIPYLR